MAATAGSGSAALVHTARSPTKPPPSVDGGTHSKRKTTGDVGVSRVAGITFFGPTRCQNARGAAGAAAGAASAGSSVKCDQKSAWRAGSGLGSGPAAGAGGRGKKRGLLTA